MSPFYSSAVFWAGAGVAVAAATFVIILVQWLTGSSRRVLTYSLLSDTALLSKGTREKAGPDLQVRLREKVLDDPHVVSMRIEFKGRRDIREADFDGSKPLTFQLGASILKRLDHGVDSEIPTILIGPDGQGVGIGPGLIVKGQVISIDLLTDGPVTLARPRPTLADVTVRQSEPDDSSDPIWIRRLQGGAFTLFGVGLFGWLISYPTPFGFVLLVFLLGALGFIISIMRAVATSWRRRSQAKAVSRQHQDELDLK
jgi:hypothetical protein